MIIRKREEGRKEMRRGCEKEEKRLEKENIQMRKIKREEKGRIK
jgi:hypothetical protein